MDNISDIDELDEVSSKEDHNSASIRLDDPSCTVVKDGPFTFVYESRPGSTAVSQNLKDVSSHKRTYADDESDHDASDNPDDSELDERPVRQLKKKPLSKRRVKKQKAEEATTRNQETGELTPLEISGHLWLETTTTVPAPSRGRSGKAKAITTVDAAQCPAFIFTANTTFSELLSAIVRSANVPLSRLTITRLFWKHETPVKGERKLLADETSYKAMLKSVQARKGNLVIFFYLPKPVTNEEPLVSTLQSIQAAGGHSNEITGRTGGMDSIKGQIDAMRNSYASQLEQLQERYPVGNHPLFPGKRIYARGKDFWDLSTMSLDVWAAAIATGRATYDAPPTSTYFTASTTIKPTRPEPSASMSTFAAYHHYREGTSTMVQPTTADAPWPGIQAPSHQIPSYQALPHQAPLYHAQQPQMLPPAPLPSSMPYPPHAPPYYPYYPPYSALPPHGPYPYYAPPLPHMLPVAPATQWPQAGNFSTSQGSHHVTNPPSTNSSPGATTSHNITLEAFCAKYAIPPGDAGRLAKMEYNPGNRLVEKFSDADRMGTGFSILGWRGFLLAHERFCKEIKAGSF